MQQIQLMGNSGLTATYTGGLGAAYSMGGDGTLGQPQPPMGIMGPQPPMEIMGLNEFGQPSRGIWPIFWGLAATASAGASAYHGYKRNESVGWAIVWGLLGGMFPIITPAVALAQGFGKAK